MSYRDAEIADPGTRLNCIIGPNGSGKSSIVCAMCVGLGGSLGVTERGDKIKECMAPEVQEAAARLGRQLKAEKPGHDVAADVVSEVAKQRMLALDAANHPSVTDPRNYKQPRTPAALRRGQSLGMGADAIDDEEQDLLSAYF